MTFSVNPLPVPWTNPFSFNLSQTIIPSMESQWSTARQKRDIASFTPPRTMHPGSSHPWSRLLRSLTPSGWTGKMSERPWIYPVTWTHGSSAMIILSIRYCLRRHCGCIRYLRDSIEFCSIQAPPMELYRPTDQKTGSRTWTGRLKKSGDPTSMIINLQVI